jgi:hypothetical protein
LALPLTSVDDVYDKDRVNCAIVEMAYAAKKRVEAAQARRDVAQGKAKPKTEPEVEDATTEGDGGDVAPPEMVHVDHPVRFFDPSRGLEIVAKVAPKEARSTGIEKGRPVAAEVFSFQWYLTAGAAEYGYTPEAGDGDRARRLQ